MRFLDSAFSSRPGEDGLPELADGAAGGAEKEILDQLLADGAASVAEGFLFPVLPHGFAHGLHVETVVLPELVVFGDDHRLLEAGRDSGKFAPIGFESLVLALFPPFLHSVLLE